MKVTLWGVFRERAGVKSPRITHKAGLTLLEIVKTIGARYGSELEGMIITSKKKLQPYVMILVNSQAGLPLKTRIKKEDIIQLFPPVCGG